MIDYPFKCSKRLKTAIIFGLLAVTGALLGIGGNAEKFY